MLSTPVLQCRTVFLIVHRRGIQHYRKHLVTWRNLVSSTQVLTVYWQLPCCSWRTVYFSFLIREVKIDSTFCASAWSFCHPLLPSILSGKWPKGLLPSDSCFSQFSSHPVTRKRCKEKGTRTQSPLQSILLSDGRWFVSLHGYWGTAWSPLK